MGVTLPPPARMAWPLLLVTVTVYVRPARVLSPDRVYVTAVPKSTAAPEVGWQVFPVKVMSVSRRVVVSALSSTSVTVMVS